MCHRPPLLTLESIERERTIEARKERTIEALKENNLELENILASLKVPKTEAITLERPIHLTFEDLVSELTIVLIPQGLTMLELEIVPLSRAIGNFYKTKI